MVNLSSFPGEKFFRSYVPPDHLQEWGLMKRKMLISVVLFVVIIPILVNSYYDSGESPDESTGKNETKRDDRETVKSSDFKKKKRSRGWKGKGEMLIDGRVKSMEEKKQVKTKVMPWYILPVLNVTILCILFGILFFSSTNIALSRLVFIAPLLHSQEADTIVAMANAAALRNLEYAQEQLNQWDDSDSSDIKIYEKQKYEKVTKEPKGWTKDRHQSYPTTDLNVAIHFNREEKAYLSKVLNARLSPLMERLYGVSRQSIRANDMFIVRYDHDGQNRLAEHTDSSHISFNILLNDEFEGGGTRFLNRFTGESAIARPSKGGVLLNNAVVMHEGLQTTKGTRYIFVGFMSIDPRDPWTGKWKDCSWFVTYLSFPWLTATLKQQFQSSVENRQSRVDINPLYTKEYWSIGILAEVVKFFSSIGDIFAPHDIIRLVDDEDRERFINSLDDEYNLHSDHFDKSSWFAGQQILTTFDGLFKSEWNDRRLNPNKFEEL